MGGNPMDAQAEMGAGDQAAGMPSVRLTPPLRSLYSANASDGAWDVRAIQSGLSSPSDYR